MIELNQQLNEAKDEYKGALDMAKALNLREEVVEIEGKLKSLN